VDALVAEPFRPYLKLRKDEAKARHMDHLSHLVAAPVVIIFGVLSALHVYWALGGRAVSSAVVPEVGGKKTFDPGPGATLVVAALLALAALDIALRSRWVELSFAPEALVRFGAWTLAVVFGLRAVGDFRTVGFFKRVRATRFAQLDSRIYSPLCAALSAGCAVVAGGP
jgi:hypothetical protein